MRISRRPKSNKLFKDEQEKKQFNESFYIENISSVLQKIKTLIILDLPESNFILI